MAGAFWCVVEDDRQGQPKKVIAELIGEARRWAAEVGGAVEAVWLTDQRGARGPGAAGGLGGVADLAVGGRRARALPGRDVGAGGRRAVARRESPRAIWGAVTSRQRELMARLAARLGAGHRRRLRRARPGGRAARGDAARLRRQAPVRVRWAKRGRGWPRCGPNVFKAAEAEPGQRPRSSARAWRGDPGDARSSSGARKPPTGLPELTEAEIVVSGGRGMKGPENYVILEELAGRHRRRGRRLARRGGRRLAAAPLPDRPDGPDHLAQALHGLRRVRRHPAPGRHADVQDHRAPSTRTPRRRSSRSRITASWVTSSRWCRS